ncbi:MAG: hypothetical protein ABJB61_03450 [bacterium]
MLNKSLTLTLAIALAGCMTQITALANSASNIDFKSELSSTDVLSKSHPDTIEVPPNGKLKVAILGLVAGAKAGKIGPRQHAQKQPTKANFSKGTKIAIGVGIAVAVVAVILIASHRAPFD